MLGGSRKGREAWYKQGKEERRRTSVEGEREIEGNEEGEGREWKLEGRRAEKKRKSRKRDGKWRGSE